MEKRNTMREIKIANPTRKAISVKEIYDSSLSGISAKAVPTPTSEILLSDDESPKILLNLEPPANGAARNKFNKIKTEKDSSKVEIISILEDESQDEDTKEDKCYYEVVYTDEDGNISAKSPDQLEESGSPEATRNLEREIALNQIMNLPRRPKGRRPKPKTEDINSSSEMFKRGQTLIKKIDTNNSGNVLKPVRILNSSLGGINQPQKFQKTECKPVKILNESLSLMVNNQDNVTRPKRIITKKIIWDPDAASISSIIEEKKTKILKPLNKSSDSSVLKRKGEVIITSKKKKLSEIDRLMADEGVQNMMNDSDSKPVLSGNTVTNAKVFKGKKKSLSKGSTDWDFVYSNDSMIVHRRSNSSYSSGRASPSRRISVDFNSSTNEDLQMQKETNDTKSKNNFKFVKPNDKMVLQQKSPVDSKTPRRSPRASSTSSNSPLNDSINKDEIIMSPKNEPQFKYINIKNYNNFVELNLLAVSYDDTYLDNISSSLNYLRNSNSLKFILLTGPEKIFSLGLKYKSLISNDMEKRYAAAKKLSEAVMHLFKTLIDFPLPIVSAINGLCQGFGTTLFSSFTSIIASDKTIFTAPYQKMGALPEGYNFLLHLNGTNKQFLDRLILFSEDINADEALAASFITKKVPANMFRKHILDTVETLSLYSVHVMRATTKFNHEKVRECYKKFSTEEKDMLVQHWTSNDFQKKIINYVKTNNL